MGLGCGAKCAKYILFVFNIIFFLLGGACLGVGIWVLLDSNASNWIDKLLNVNSDVAGITSSFDVAGLLKTGAYMLIAGGGAVFVIGFLGCCGAVKEWRPLLVLYAILIGIIFIIEITGGVLAVVFNGRVQTEVKTYLTGTIKDKFDGKLNTSEPISLAWNYAMGELQCCGVTNGSDFNNASAWDKTVTYNGASVTVTYPLSCCKLTDSGKTKYKNGQIGSLSNSDYVDIANCVNSPSTTNANIDIGCYDKVKDLVMSYSSIVLGIGIGIAVVQLLGIIFACCLCRSITKNLNEVV
ncbi:tetraspanin-18 isoform X2 [Lingula anatina]|uniref:Tetraspanin n=1 Tax=Lingula anatina TaxID=7574 RepID=A0A1S3HJZ4_LINAN|nr:tetraspanin-18 isoform X2 [Lingula anatina]|eukprot:XP_013385776.1 tetraspanin-18 isoform X2 [Lingula anatina]